MIRTIFVVLSISMVAAGCALQFSQPDIGPSTARESAAWQLTQEGIQHLNAGRPDNAIRSFEQAIGLNPNNGQCYFYMAQAWMAKGVISEARQFNSLARDYLKDDPGWEERVLEQSYRIEQLSE